MRKLDKLIIALLILIIGFQSYANFRLLESIESNTDFIYDAVMLPFEEGFHESSLISKMDHKRATTKGEIGIFN